MRVARSERRATLINQISTAAADQMPGFPFCTKYSTVCSEEFAKEQRPCGST